MNKTKSPIKARPLRNPGESLQRKILDLIVDHQIKYLLVTGGLIILAMNAWYYHIVDRVPEPWGFTIIAVISFFVFLYNYYVTNKNIDKYKLGLDGEKAVGQFLDGLKKNGYEVFHDFLFDGFNIDHVVISKHGVFSIETKTYRKPEKGSAKILYDGKSLLINGFRSSSQLIQAQAGAKSIHELIEKMTGKCITVKPVLLFPGWFVEKTNGTANNHIWVLEPKSFPAFVEKHPEELSVEMIKLIQYNLSRHVRNL